MIDLYPAIDLLDGKVVRLRLSMKDADVFAFQFVR